MIHCLIPRFSGSNLSVIFESKDMISEIRGSVPSDLVERLFAEGDIVYFLQLLIRFHSSISNRIKGFQETILTSLPRDDNIVSRKPYSERNTIHESRRITQ